MVLGRQSCIRGGIAFCVLLSFAASGRAQVPQVVDMAHPGAGIRTILPDWGWSQGTRPMFIGDIDGDGFDDFGIKQEDAHFNLPSPWTWIIYGTAEGPDRARMEDLRHTKLLHGDGFAGELSGFDCAVYMAPAGDANGDGFDDFLFGSCSTNWNGVQDSGVVLLIHGGPHYPDEVRLDALQDAGILSTALVSSSEMDRHVGTWLSRAGDLDGDGHEDYAFSSVRTAGVEDGQPGAGSVFVLYGPLALEGTVHVEDFGSSVPGFVFSGDRGEHLPEDGDGLGRSMAPVGDVNGDGFDDLLVGAPTATRGDLHERGAAYLVFGGPSIPERFSGMTLGSAGVEFLGGFRLGWLGWDVAAAGDVDGDGLQDFLLNAPGTTDPRPGELCLIYGAPEYPPSVSVNDDEIRMLRITSTLTDPPAVENTSFSWGVAGAGDVNGDGFADFLTSALYERRGFERVGAAYLVHGGPSLPTHARDTDVGAASLSGWKLLGAVPFATFGNIVSAGGDFDGDGTGDFLVVSEWTGRQEVPPQGDAIYVVSGARAFRDGLKLNAVTPAAGSVEGGSPLVLQGGDFESGMRVWFGDREAGNVEVVSSSEARVESPPQAPGRVRVTVTSGLSSASSDDAFEYVPAPRFPQLDLHVADLGNAPYRTFLYEFPMEPTTFTRRAFASTALGDLNGDGIDDLIIGQRFSGWEVAGVARRAQVTVIFGSEDLPSRLTEEELGAQGCIIHGERGAGGLGGDIALPGDVDGDGLNDLVLLDADSVVLAYVMHGRREWPSELFLDEELASGFASPITLYGCSSGNIAGAGDLDRDGMPDLLAGNSSCEGDLGAVNLYLDGLQGAPATWEPSSRILGDPMRVPLLNNGETARVFGAALSSPGDLNGDGFADLAVGAAHASGEVHLLLGMHWDFIGASELEFFELGRGVRIRSELTVADLGNVVSPAGDFNGDGLPDVLVGRPRGGPGWQGDTAVFFGSAALGGTIDTIDLERDTDRRVLIVGEDPYDRAGYAGGIGDFSGDGLTDIGIVSMGFQNALPRAHVVFGSTSPPAEISLSELGVQGFRIVGEPGCWFSSGEHGMSGGDLDGDGIRDLAIGGRCLAGGWVVVVFGGSRTNSRFIRGEVNQDGRVDISDAVMILGYLFLGGAAPACLAAADADDSHTIEITDAVFLLGALFLGNNVVPPPYPDCGTDPTPSGEPGCREGC